MDFEELEERAVRAVAAMSERAARRIAEGDEASIAIAFSTEQRPTDEDVAELRHLLHGLCKERVAGGGGGGDRKIPPAFHC